MKFSVAREPSDNAREVWKVVMSDDFKLSFVRFELWQRPAEIAPFVLVKFWQHVDLFNLSTLPQPALESWAVEAAKTYIISQITINEL